MNFTIYSLATRENWGLCFLDAEDYFAQSLEALGHKVSYALKTSQDTDYYLVFGWHLSPKWRELPKEKVIVVQLENLVTGALANGFSPLVFSGIQVWEYSYFNVCRYEKEARSVSVFNYGFLETMQEYDHQTCPGYTYDLYFVGSMTSRRRQILDSLEMNRLTTKTDFGVFGVEVDRAMRECKAIISPHAYHKHSVWGIGHIPATLRIAYALNQNAPVFAEESGDEMTDRYWSRYVTLFNAKNAASVIVTAMELRWQETLDKTRTWRSERSMKREVERLLRIMP